MEARSQRGRLVLIHQPHIHQQNSCLRECRLALLDVLALRTRAGFPAEVHGNAHEEPALVEEIAGDVHAHQQQEKDNNKDANNGPGAQA